MKAEAKVQTDIIKYVKSIGGYVIKVMRANINGVPDLLICVDGKFIGCEVKAEKFESNPTKQMSAWQVKNGEMIKASNGIFICCASIEQFKKELHVNSSEDNTRG